MYFVLYHDDGDLHLRGEDEGQRQYDHNVLQGEVLSSLYRLRR
jgi:hypothetical protein